MVVVLRNSLLLCVIAIIAVAIFHYFNVSFFYLETRPLDRVLFKASCFPTCFREKKDKADVRQFKILIVKQIRAPYSSCIWAIQSNNNRSCNQLQIFLTNDFILHPQPSNSNEESVFFLYSASYTYRSLLEIDELPDIAKPIRYLCVCRKRKIND